MPGNRMSNTTATGRRRRISSEALDSVTCADNLHAGPDQVGRQQLLGCPVIINDHRRIRGRRHARRCRHWLRRRSSERHGHVKGAAHPDLGLEPDSPTQQGHDLAAERQSEPGPLFARGDRDDLAGTTRRSVPSPLAAMPGPLSRTVITSSLPTGSADDVDPPAIGGELDRVAQQVHQDLTQSQLVGLDLVDVSRPRS